jgi:hypothetical protein
VVSNRTESKEKWSSAAAHRLLKLAGDPKTVDEAARIVAEKLLVGIPTIPTDLDALRPRLNVSAFVADEDLPISGELRKCGENYEVVYSPLHSLERQRFTIAHELGHAILQGTGPNCPRVGKELELVCNMLATELLMPRKSFVETAGRPLSLDGVRTLARHFRVSLTAAARRSSQLFDLGFFEADRTKVIWASGLAKLTRNLPLRKSVIQGIVSHAFTTVSENRVIFFANLDGAARDWSAEWMSLSNLDHYLFLLRPYLDRNRLPQRQRLMPSGETNKPSISH